MEKEFKKIMLKTSLLTDMHKIMEWGGNQDIGAITQHLQKTPGLKPEWLKNLIDYYITEDPIFIEKAFVTDNFNRSVLQWKTEFERLSKIWLENISPEAKPFINNYLTTLKLMDFNEYKNPKAIDLIDMIEKYSFNVPTSSFVSRDINRDILSDRIWTWNRHNFTKYTPLNVSVMNQEEIDSAIENINNFSPKLREIIWEKVTLAKTNIVIDEFWADASYSFNKVKTLSQITQDPIVFKNALSVINRLETISNLVTPLQKIKISNEMIRNEVEKFN